MSLTGTLPNSFQPITTELVRICKTVSANHSLQCQFPLGKNCYTLEK